MKNKIRWFVGDWIIYKVEKIKDNRIKVSWKTNVFTNSVEYSEKQLKYWIDNNVMREVPESEIVFLI